jgi:YVTN family beta-propeller protein
MATCPPDDSRRPPRWRSRTALLLAITAATAGLAAIPALASTAAGTHAIKPDLAAATITVGSDPSAVAVDTTTHVAYVANEGSGTVTPISESYNAATGQMTYTPGAPIAVGSEPSALAVDPDTHASLGTDTVWVANTGDGTVSVINEATGRVIQTINVDVNGSYEDPDGVVVDTGNDTVYVFQYYGFITAINDQTDAVTQFYNTGGTTHLTQGAVDPAISTLFAGAQDDRAVLEISTSGAAGKLTGTLGGVGLPHMAIELNPAIGGYPGYLDVSTFDSNPGVAIYNDLTATPPAGRVWNYFHLPSYPGAVAVNPATDTMYAAMPGATGTTDGSVETVTPASGQTPTAGAAVTVGTGALNLALDTSEGPTGTIVFVSNYNSGTVTAFTG